MSYGIKISREGEDVKTASGNELVLSSEHNMLKGKQFDEVSYTFSGSPSSVTVATVNHNLGYKPATLVYFRSNQSGVRFRHGQLPFHDGTALPDIIDYYVTNTQLIIKYTSNKSTPTNRTGQTFIFKYYIMYDEGE